MGVFTVTIEVGNPRGERLERVEALVDTDVGRPKADRRTGASALTLPWLTSP
jgi:hypothetical protein